nr:hypothetical protein [Parasporobacterium sp.]
SQSYDASASLPAGTAVGITLGKEKETTEAQKYSGSVDTSLSATGVISLSGYNDGDHIVVTAYLYSADGTIIGQPSSEGTSIPSTLSYSNLDDKPIKYKVVYSYTKDGNPVSEQSSTIGL